MRILNFALIGLLSLPVFSQDNMIYYEISDPISVREVGAPGEKKVAAKRKVKAKPKPKPQTKKWARLKPRKTLRLKKIKSTHAAWLVEMELLKSTLAESSKKMSESMTTGFLSEYVSKMPTKMKMLKDSVKEVEDLSKEIEEDSLEGCSRMIDTIVCGVEVFYLRKTVEKANVDNSQKGLNEEVETVVPVEAVTPSSKTKDQ